MKMQSQLNKLIVKLPNYGWISEEGMNKSTLPQRMLWAMQRKAQIDGHKVTAADLMRATNASRTAVSFWLNGGNGIRGDFARKAAAFLDVDPVWLETGDGDPELRPMSEVSSIVGLHNKVIPFDGDSHTHIEIRKVKLQLSAGITGFSAELDNDDGRPISFMRRWFDENGYVPKRLIAINVKGESMEPTMSKGDTVVINTADIIPEDGKVFAVNYEGEAVIKRLIRDSGEWYVASDNPDQRRFARKLCTGESCIIIGRVVVLQREKF